MPKKVAKQLRHVEILEDESYMRQPYVKGKPFKSISLKYSYVSFFGAGEHSDTGLIFELVNQLVLPVIQLTACVAT